MTVLRGNREHLLTKLMNGEMEVWDMENFDRISEAKEEKEAVELLEKYIKLQDQINNPTRFGMIEALSGAQNIARQEITSLEQSQGDIYLMPWTSFKDQDLYRKLPQYKEGLYNHAVKKFGEEAFKKWLKEYEKSQNQ